MIKKQAFSGWKSEIQSYISAGVLANDFLFAGKGSSK